MRFSLVGELSIETWWWIAMNDWKLFCEFSLVVMVVMFGLWFAVMSNWMNCSDQIDQEGAEQGRQKESLPDVPGARVGSIEK